MKLLLEILVGIAALIGAVVAFGQYLIWSDAKEQRLFPKSKWRLTQRLEFSKPWIAGDKAAGSREWEIIGFQVRRHGLKQKTELFIRRKNWQTYRTIDIDDFRQVSKDTPQD